METTATNDASFHNVMKEHKATTVANLIKFLSLLPAIVMVLGIFVNLVLLPFNMAIPRSLWIPAVMIVIFIVQLAVRYLTDHSFSTKDTGFLVSCITACIWFMGFVSNL
jgi:hypothetical protein